MAFIKGISYYLPERVVTNEELLQEFPEWSVDKVAAKVGVNSRHLAAADETAGDMAEKAARKLFEEYNINPKDIDFLLLCTQSPDYFLPSTACILQNRLGIPKIACHSSLKITYLQATLTFLLPKFSPSGQQATRLWHWKMRQNVKS